MICKCTDKRVEITPPMLKNAKNIYFPDFSKKASIYRTYKKTAPDRNASIGGFSYIYSAEGRCLFMVDVTCHVSRLLFQAELFEGCGGYCLFVEVDIHCFCAEIRH